MGAELANGVFRDSLGGWVDMVEASPPDDGVPIGIFTTHFQASLAALVLGITGGLVLAAPLTSRQAFAAYQTGAGKMPPPYSSIYCGTKGALDSITVSLSKELGGRRYG